VIASVSRQTIGSVNLKINQLAVVRRLQSS